MTLRTGQGSAGGTYRYHTCSTKARQGKTGCKGRTIPMDKLDHLVADHLESGLLQPERLETILARVLDRRRERTERRREHLAELHKRIAETDQRIGRLYDAIETGVADPDESLKERIAGLKAIREQAASDAARTEAALDNAGNQVWEEWVDHDNLPIRSASQVHLVPRHCLLAVHVTAAVTTDGTVPPHAARD